MKFDIGAGQIQPKPGTFEFAVDRAIDLIKWIGHALEMFSVDADAVVANDK